MLERCEANGLEIDPAVWAKYEAVDSAVNGLEEIDESWSLLWGIPEHRKVASDSTIASSVASRLEHLRDYLPANLVSDGRAVAGQYIQVVARLETYWRDCGVREWTASFICGRLRA